jgi:ATP/maltotriose-dependent transcriptional regulator MalT
MVLALNLHPPLAVLPRGLQRIEHFCQRAVSFVETPISPLQLAIDGLMSFVHLWRGRPEEAIQAGERALEIKKQLGGFPFLGVDPITYLAITHAALGDYAAADGYFDLLFGQIGQVGLYKATASTHLYALGRMRWLQGRLEEARQVYARMREEQEAAAAPQAAMLCAMMHALLEMADPATSSRPTRRYVEAERSLLQAISLEQKGLTTLSGSPHLLLAHLHWAKNRPQDALAELEPVLARCEQEGILGLILQEGALVVPVLRLAVEQDIHAPFAAHLLDLLGATREPRPLLVSETGETLTPREIEVLRLVAAGATNPAIAEDLVITERTVKAHVSSILRKLDVSSRVQAASRARDLRII